MEEKEIVGKHILVGLMYLDSEGEVQDIVQLHGIITSISEGTLYFERADGEGEFSIPFEGELESGDPDAVYKLKSTGEEVTDVEFISSWTIHAPENDD